MTRTIWTAPFSAFLSIRHGAWLLSALLGCASLAPASAAVPSAAGTAYPNRPIRFVIPATPGGSTDIIARTVGTQLTEAWGQNVIIDNRAGGGHTLAGDVVARAAPDGYTLLFAPSSVTVHVSLYRKMSYDLVRDFAPVSLLASAPNVLVAHPSVKARTLKEFIALSKASPQQMNYGSSGNGGTGHLAMELLKSTVGIDLVHIPYRSGGAALVAVVAGEVPVEITNVVAATPHIKAGRLQALGVTSSHRVKHLPDVPTIAEAGVPGFEAIAWFGVFARTGTPSAIIAKLNAEMVRTMKLPAVSERLAGDGAEAVGNSPQEFAAVIRSDIAKWARVIKTAGIAPD